MGEYTPEIESLASEELLSIVLAMVAPAESDPAREYGLRFEAQRAATELYCRAASARRAEQGGPAADVVWSVRQLHGR